MDGSPGLLNISAAAAAVAVYNSVMKKILTLWVMQKYILGTPVA